MVIFSLSFVIIILIGIIAITNFSIFSREWLIGMGITIAGIIGIIIIAYKKIQNKI